MLAIVVWAAQSMAAYISASIAGDLSEIEAFYLRNPQGAWPPLPARQLPTSLPANRCTGAPPRRDTQHSMSL